MKKKEEEEEKKKKKRKKEISEEKITAPSAGSNLCLDVQRQPTC